MVLWCFLQEKINVSKNKTFFKEINQLCGIVFLCNCGRDALLATAQLFFDGYCARAVEHTIYQFGFCICCVFFGLYRAVFIWLSGIGLCWAQGFMVEMDVGWNVGLCNQQQCRTRGGQRWRNKISFIHALARPWFRYYKNVNFFWFYIFSWLCRDSGHRILFGAFWYVCTKCRGIIWCERVVYRMRICVISILCNINRVQK